MEANRNKKLLIPGWAGNLNAEELKYIKTNRKLRARWDFVKGTGRITIDKIKNSGNRGTSRSSFQG